MIHFGKKLSLAKNAFKIKNVKQRVDMSYIHVLYKFVELETHVYYM